MFKLHPQFDLVLRDILKGDANGLVVLLEDVRPAYTRLYLKRLQAVLAGDNAKPESNVKAATEELQRPLGSATESGGSASDLFARVRVVPRPNGVEAFYQLLKQVV